MNSFFGPKILGKPSFSTDFAPQIGGIIENSNPNRGVARNGLKLASTIPLCDLSTPQKRYGPFGVHGITQYFAAVKAGMGRPSGRYLSDLRYVDGSARFGEQMDTTRDRVEAEVGLSLLSLAPHIDSSFVIYSARKRRPSSRFDSISSPHQRVFG